MKHKTVSFLLVLAIAASAFIIAFVGCGPEEVEPPPPPPPTTPPTAPPSLPSGEGFTWNDMPVYSGAKQVQKGTWAIPPAEGEWSRVEWRYYETGGSMSEVVTFYKSQMPGNGWQETTWMEMQEMSWGVYNKNNEQDAAMVWIGSEEGKTFFALMRARE